MIIRNYWNSAWRNLMKRKGFSFINIFGLAVGMASALLIFTYVAFEFSFDKMSNEGLHSAHPRTKIQFGGFRGPSQAIRLTFCHFVSGGDFS